MLEVSSPDYSQLLDAYLKARDAFRLADKNYARAQDLYEHNAIAERDLQQAESDRNQAQADLNASEQGMKILGIKNPDDLAKAPVFGANSVARADRRRSGRAARLAGPGDAGRADAGVHDFRHEHGMGARERLPGRSRVRAQRRRRRRADRRVSRHVSRKDFLRLARAGSEYAHAAGAHRGG